MPKALKVERSKSTPEVTEKKCLKSKVTIHGIFEIVPLLAGLFRIEQI